MREKGIAGAFVLVVVLLIAVGAVGYYFFFNKRAQIDRAIKPDTTIKNVLDVARNEIVESGYDVKVVITPSNKNVISKTVTITATEASDQAAGVGFFVTSDEKGFMNEGLPNINLDRDGTDGWSTPFDTTEYENGNYFVNVIVYPSGGEGSPLGIAQIPVEISN